MTTPGAASTTAASGLVNQLGHIRWIAGGTGSGKSTVAAALARRFDLHVYAGDRAEHDWLTRCSPDGHPHVAAQRHQRPGDMWRGRTPQEVFDAMASLHGETMGFLVEDLLALPTDRVVLVDYFGVLPHDLAPRLSWPEQAAFLIPTPGFRRAALSSRYSDADRARANWGNLDPAAVLEIRLGRDELWDAEVNKQAAALHLPLLTIDGHRPLATLVDNLAERFQLNDPRGRDAAVKRCGRGMWTGDPLTIGWGK